MASLRLTLTVATSVTLCMMAPYAPDSRAGDVIEPPAEQAQAMSKPVTFPVTYTGEGLANISGGYKSGAIVEGLLNVGIQLDLDRLTGWKGASLLVSGLDPHGPGLSQKYVHDLGPVSNIDAYDSVRLYEAWLQQDLADGIWSIRLGQILADTEFFVCDSSALFLNGAFGAIPLISHNFNAPIFPVAAPGVRVRWIGDDSVSVQAGFFDGDTGNPASDNKHGVDWSLNDGEGLLAIAEVAYKLNGRNDGEGLCGVYKLGAFFHSVEVNNTLSGSQHRANAGGYFIADQQLWCVPGCKDKGLSGFLSVGGAPGDRNAVPFYCNAGFDFKGLLPGREADISGVGFSYTRLSATGDPFASHHEALFEVSYKAVIKEWFSVQPDFQYIFNPGASRNTPNAVVAGIRLNLTFQ